MKCYFCLKKNVDECKCEMTQFHESDLSICLCNECYKNLINGIEMCKSKASPDKIQNHVSLLNNINHNDLNKLINEANKKMKL